MLSNYFKIAVRNLTKHSVYSFINITGLSIGIASSILILLWVADEISFDRFHKNYDRLYQVYMNQEFANGIGSQKTLPYAYYQLTINPSLLTNYHFRPHSHNPDRNRAIVIPLMCYLKSIEGFKLA